MKMHFNGNVHQCKQTCGCLKGLHTCEIHTNITTIVQKTIFVTIYSSLCQFLCHYFYYCHFKLLWFR